MPPIDSASLQGILLLHTIVCSTRSTEYCVCVLLIVLAPANECGSKERDHLLLEL